MKNISIDIPSKVDKSEFSKTIGFVSEKILSYQIENDVLKVSVSDEADTQKIENELIRMMKHHISTQKISGDYFSNDVSHDYCDGRELLCIHKMDSGMVALSDEALFLYRYFEKTFCEIAHKAEKENCVDRLYPVMIPVDAYRKTNYLTESPQYSIFCCNSIEDLDMLSDLNESIDKGTVSDKLSEPAYALSPSACFHTYLEFNKKTIKNNTTVTFTQSVFRNEGRFNFSDFGRLRDYHVREIVFLGNENYVIEMRSKVLSEAIDVMNKLGLCGKVLIASDPFVIPEMQKFKKLQVMRETKYELRLNYESDKTLACASFNLHGTAFTHPFSIELSGESNTVTGCVGFGLERWVLAFLSQYGINIDNWPECVRKEYL